MINRRTADQLVATAVDAISARPDSFHEMLEDIPAAIYVTDAEGTLTWYNQACVALAGRTPTIGADKWCVTWKLFTADGAPLPHERCPMAEALRSRAPVRDVEAVAERPDGSRVRVAPFPTPLFDSAGNLAGAVNLVLDLTRQRTPAYLLDQAARCRRLAGEIDDREATEALALIAARYEAQARKLNN